MFLGATSTRCKYYCVWSLSEGSCILSGFGYNGMDTKTGQHRWDRLSNYNLRYCELADSYKSLTNNWNIGANHWLKHYVYVRLVPPNTKPTTFAMVITYIVSSVWHGFHPGYYCKCMCDISSRSMLITRMTCSVVHQYRSLSNVGSSYSSLCTSSGDVT